MFKTLERYIAKTNLLATVFVSAILSGVLFLITLLGELKNIGEGDYGILQALWYVVLRLPNDIYQFSPLLLLLGSIVGLSILSSHRELAVMRTSGFSIRRIISTVLFAAFLLILFVGVVGEWATPHLSYKAEVHKENARNEGQAVVTATGVWFHVDNNFIHIDQVVGRELLEGVTRYEFDYQHRLQAAYYAKKLAFKNHGWVMYDGVKTSFYKDRVQSKQFSEALWSLQFNTNLLNVGLVEPNQMSLTRLARFSRYLEENGLQATQYQYEFWHRVFQPLTSLVMIFLAIPFVLGTMMTATLGWRIVIGIVFGFVFFILNDFLGQISIVYQLPVMVAAILPLIFFTTLGIILMKVLIKR